MTTIIHINVKHNFRTNDDMPHKHLRNDILIELVVDQVQNPSKRKDMRPMEK